LGQGSDVDSNDMLMQQSEHPSIVVQKFAHAIQRGFAKSSNETHHNNWPLNKMLNPWKLFLKFQLNPTSGFDKC